MSTGTDSGRVVRCRLGADPDTVGVERATVRVSSSAVRERLMGALDRLLRAERSAAVRAALHGLDPDTFRDAVRDAARDNDTAARVRLASQSEALTQLPGFAAFLGESWAIGPERRRAMLVTAVQRRSGKLGLLMALGNSYPVNQREGSEARVRWFQAAVAAVQDNCTAHNNLGTALSDTKDLAVSILTQLAAGFPSRPGYRQLLAGAYNGWGNLQCSTGRLAEAE